MVKKQNKQSNKNHILARYGCISLLIVLISVAIITKLSITTLVKANEWNERARQELSKTVEIPPTRGSILAGNGNILACNLRVYDIRMDLRHPKLSKFTTEEWDDIMTLGDSLDLYYPRVKEGDSISKRTWKQLLTEELSKTRLKDRNAVVTVGSKMSMDDFERIRKWPYLCGIKAKGRGCPLYYEENSVRTYPYGHMARLSIGRVYEDSVTGRIKGYAGLEMALDSLLYGTPGRARKVAISATGDNTDIPAKRGYDILTTIDIDIQDIVEEELLRVCSDEGINVEWGTAILMEVSTGEIKAISNVERNKKTGKYEEAMNRAVMAYEPGSVMKPISLMIAFEDGLVKDVTDQVICTPFQNTSDHAGGGYKNMKEVIETSSNPGIARVIFRGYENCPEKFYDRLAKIGFFEPMHSGIGGETTPRVARLVDTDSKGRPITMKARHLDLARQAYGYNTAIPPLYTLSYYNAIANGGNYITPHLVRALIDENGRDSSLTARYPTKRVCSEATAAKVKTCLREVVWGKRGTGRVLQDDRVVIAGKTGTVYPYDHKVLKGYDKSKRRYAFAGFYPYEHPKYSCIVLIQTGAATSSAARSSGTVLKNIALKLYSRGLLDNHSSYTDTKNESAPVLTASSGAQTAKVVENLSLKNPKQLQTKPEAGAGKVPDVRGMDVATAVRVLEKRGLNVEVKGKGAVASQSIAPGQPLKKGAKIVLTLKV